MGWVHLHHPNLSKTWSELLTCTHSDFVSGLVSWKVTVHALVWVTDVPFVAWLSDLPGTALAAATAIQDRAHPWGAVWSSLTLAGPVAELPPLGCRLSISCSQLPIVPFLAVALWGWTYLLNLLTTTHMFEWNGIKKEWNGRFRQAQSCANLAIRIPHYIFLHLPQWASSLTATTITFLNFGTPYNHIS